MLLGGRPEKPYVFQCLDGAGRRLTLTGTLRRFRPTERGFAMASEPDPDRLRALEARLAKVKGQAPPPKTNTVKGFSQGEVAWRMVIELVTGMLLGMGIGYGLDVLFGTLPVFLIIFSLVGFAAGIKTMLGSARQLAQKAADTAAKGERD
jgi:ATP synthase protein I